MAGSAETLRLGNVCTKIGSGATPRGGKESYLDSGPYSLIRSQNVRNDGFAREGLAYISEGQARALDGVTVQPGDVLLNITGDSVARVCQVAADVLPARVNQHVAIIRPDPEVLDPRYLRYWLVSPTVQSHLLGWSSAGATRNALTKSMIEDLAVPALGIEEQRRTAHILGTLDDKIELNRRMNETLEEMARALFKSWFVDFDPVRAKAEGRDTGLPKHLADLFPDRLVDSELGEIPEGWAVVDVGELADIVGGSTPSTKVAEFWTDGTVPFATPKDLSQLASPVLQATERCITNAGLAQIGSGALPIGTVLMSSRAPIGYLAVTDTHVAINQGIVAMVAATDVSNLFLLHWAQQAQPTIVARANGSTFLEISKSSFRGIKVVRCPTVVMAEFERQARPLYDRVVAGVSETAGLVDARNRLLAKLLTPAPNEVE